MNFAYLCCMSSNSVIMPSKLLPISTEHGEMGSNGFNKVRAVQPHQAPPKIDQKVAPLHKKLLNFYKGALEH